ncbi:hypothetical protein Vretifemale_13847, partial [Volvox reticuliferus]
TPKSQVQVNARPAYHHHQHHQQSQSQSHGDKAGVKKLPPLTAAVAALLRYCLSDLDEIVPQAGVGATATGGGGGGAGAGHATPPGHQQQQQQQQLQRLQLELDGLPLLPLADGTLGRLQVYQPPAVKGTKLPPRGRSGAPASVNVAYVLTHGPLELELLAELRYRCLASDLPGPLLERLEQVVDQRLFNVQHLSPSLLDSTLLPLLLPPSWKGADEVEWGPLLQPALQQQPHQPVPSARHGDPQLQQQQQQSSIAATAATAAAQQGPTVEWIRALWAWLASREDVLQLASWPVLPIQGGRLRRLQDKSLVLREGDWTEAVSSALTRLGCRLLDTAQLQGGGLSRGLGASTGNGGEQQQQQPQQPQPAGLGNGAAAAAVAAVASPALQACVQQPSLTGVMAAIAAAKARALSQVQVQPQGQGGGLPGVSGPAGDRRSG